MELAKKFAATVAATLKRIISRPAPEPPAALARKKRTRPVPVFGPQLPNWYELLDQDVVWVTRDKRYMLLENMTRQHRTNTALMLLRDAVRIQTGYGFWYLSNTRGPMFGYDDEMHGYEESRIAACEAPNYWSFETRHRDPAEESRAWLEAKPLIRRLRGLSVAEVSAPTGAVLLGEPEPTKTLITLS